MAGIPPLHRLRKTTVVFVVVFLAFIIHRFVVFIASDSVLRDAEYTELSLAQGVVCRHIVKETPFGTDSVFEEGSRLYFYTTMSQSARNTEDTLKHVWYFQGDTMQVSVCAMKNNGETCYTEILPASLKPGEWSVDLVAGRKLLFSKQFEIAPVGR